MDSGNNSSSAGSSPRVKAEDQDGRFVDFNQSSGNGSTPVGLNQESQIGQDFTTAKHRESQYTGDEDVDTTADQSHQPNPNAGIHIANGEGENEDTDDHTSKKPRLRLAHACDRCRRRKIRCDTQQPCGPCKQTGTVCTFETPSRRLMKKRERDEIDTPTASTSSGAPISSSSRPKAGRKGSQNPGAASSSSNKGTGLANANAVNQTAYTSTLETRLNNLEALLRSIPPGVHNALINNLEGQLAVGSTADPSSSVARDMQGIINTTDHQAGQDYTNVQLRDGGNISGGPAMPSRAGPLNGSGDSRGINLANLGIAQSPFGINLSANNVNPDFTLATGLQPYSGLNGMSHKGHSAGGYNMGSAPSGHSRTSIPDPYSNNPMSGMDFGNFDVNQPTLEDFVTERNPGDASDGLDEVERGLEGLNLSNGYLYVDEIGQTKWQGATSGFPLLDLLTANSAEHKVSNSHDNKETSQPNPFADTEQSRGAASSSPTTSHSDDPIVERRGRTLSTAAATKPTFSRVKVNVDGTASQGREEKFFPDRAPRPSQMLNPEATWRVITNVIPSDLMDTLVRCYLSTSHLLWPFLHVPSFLKDYADPQKWAEPGFACFVVAVCTLSSRHVDDPRVRAKADDPSTAGKQYFELFKRLRDLPSADRPTLYSIQAAFLAAIFAFGLGTLSKAFSLLAESVTLCLDGGLHRSVEGYDYFNAIEAEMRKRTFWSIYSWDKQSAALFGRPSVIHLRDCDVPEPLQIDDEYLTKEKILEQPKGHQTRLSAFVAVIRLHVVLEGVIDSCVAPSTFENSSFLSKAASTISRRCQAGTLAEGEELLEEWVSILPKHWHYDVECVESKDPIRITQAERLHCLEHLVRMIVYRHRFSSFVQAPAETDEEKARHLMYCRKAMDSALTICANHVHISQRGMMTYYGVHVIHQLAQAGRTLVAVILNCKTPEFAGLIAPATEGLRSCVGLLRRFSGRYLCGLRSADIIEEFCRICHIPVETPRPVTIDTRPSPAWLRPVQRRHSPSPAPVRRRRMPSSQTHSRPGLPDGQGTRPGPSGIQANKPDLNSYFTDALDNPASANALLSTQDFFDLSAAASPIAGMPPNNSVGGIVGIFDTLGPASAPYDQFESLEPDSVMNDGVADMAQNTWDVPFAPGNDVLGNMSASTILDLMRQGTFSQSWS